MPQVVGLNDTHNATFESALPLPGNVNELLVSRDGIHGRPLVEMALSLEGMCSNQAHDCGMVHASMGFLLLRGAHLAVKPCGCVHTSTSCVHTLL